MTHKYTYAAALVTVTALSAACSKGETAQAKGREDAPKPVQTERVREENVRRSVEVVGTLAAVDEVTISSEADGIVAKILHDLGDRVKAGDTLVELDREKAEYNLDQQKAALQRALAQYGAPDPEHLPPIERTPDVQKAKAELVQAQVSFDRTKELQSRQLVPKQTLDDADAILQSKKASYDSSLQNAKNLQANIAAADAAARLADRQLRDTYIRAPFDGYVQRRMVNLGQLVKGATGSPVPVMSLVRLDPLKVTAEIPEKMVPWITVGQPVELHVDAYPDKAIAGRMSRISPAVNTATRAFPFEALVPNTDALLKPGTFARVRIATDKTDRVLTLPYAALQYRYGVNRVFVVNGDRLAAKELKVGERLGDRIEIVSGIDAGQPVAMTDVDKLVDGTRVSVKSAAE
ncbi:MAG TPA: efflux RND transporter periplasmic adaptor subunit [Vicinamibacterales bacterium]|nr:efflux RND transporter periplasmic adaptor subunit [Vicinamibacterales bacterium]